MLTLERKLILIGFSDKFSFFSRNIVGLLWKRHAVITVVKYSDDTSEPQTIALDFMANTKYAQPLMTEGCERPEIYLVMTILNRQYQSLTN